MKVNQLDHESNPFSDLPQLPLEDERLWVNNEQNWMKGYWMIGKVSSTFGLFSEFRAVVSRFWHGDDHRDETYLSLFIWVEILICLPMALFHYFIALIRPIVRHIKKLSVIQFECKCRSHMNPTVRRSRSRLFITFWQHHPYVVTDLARAFLDRVSTSE
jgi:hypothetical protein